METNFQFVSIRKMSVMLREYETEANREERICLLLSKCQLVSREDYFRHQSEPYIMVQMVLQCKH